MDTALGILLVTLAGLATGSCFWPMKLIRRFRFEHYWFIGMLPLIIIPWAVEWAPHKIRVNAVGPCQVMTPSLERVLNSGLHGGRAAMTEKMLSRIPMGRFAEAEDMVGPTILLASAEAAMVTGQVLFVDGGNTSQ